MLISALILVIQPGWLSPFMQNAEVEYFAETGHSVTGEFLTAYRSVPDPLKVYGYPLTDAFQDQESQRWVQYFQRARFELHPEAPPDLRVRLTPIGEHLYKPGQGLPVPPNFPACRTFSETGFQVCYSFLDFFNDNGGVAQFGYPISNFEQHDNFIVQYFQRARFEWRPELPPGQRVALTDLGEVFFEQQSEDPIRLLPSRDNAVAQATLALKVHAFVTRSVTSGDGDQTVYVIVQDQNQMPVAGAQVVLVVRLPSGDESRLIVPEVTNEHGITRHTFHFTSPVNGSARLEVRASYLGLDQTTQTSFRIWW